jgi:hypothetical protein
MVAYAVDDAGRPVFFLSSMATHSHNLAADPRASLTVIEPGAEDPMAAARVTLVGTVAEAPAEEVRELYLSRHENAREWADFADFAYYRMEVAAAYFIGGFGVMAGSRDQNQARRYNQRSSPPWAPSRDSSPRSATSNPTGFRSTSAAPASPVST